VTCRAADGAAIGPCLPVAAISVSITGEGGFRHLPHLSLRSRASYGPHAARPEAQSLCPAHPKHPSTKAASNEAPPWSLPSVLQWWDRKTSLGVSFALHSGPLSLARPGRAHHHSRRRADLAGQRRLGAARARDGTKRPAPSGRPQATHAKQLAACALSRFLSCGEARRSQQLCSVSTRHGPICRRHVRHCQVSQTYGRDETRKYHMKAHSHSLDERPKRRTGWPSHSSAFSCPPLSTTKTPTDALPLQEGIPGLLWWSSRMA